MLRFECPRCQTVFTRDKGDDDAFVECPSCGALAMSAGDATGVDSDALARTMSSSHDISSFQPPDPDATAEGDDDSANDSRDSRDSAVDDDNRAADDSAADDSADDDSAADDSEQTTRPSLASEDPVGDGIFSGLLGPALGDDHLGTPPPVADRGDDARIAGGGLDLGLDDELGDFELPSTAPAARALSPATKAPRPRRRDADEPRPAPPPPPPEVAASLSDDAMGALEAAFDTMAARPEQPRGDGLSDDERRFLENVAGAGPPPPPPRGVTTKPPPRPPERPGVPRAAPPPLKRKTNSTAFALSDEARSAAFIPLKVKPVAVAAPMAPRMAATAPPDPEVTEPGLAATAARKQRPRPVAAPEPRVLKSEPIVRERPTVFGGLHKGILAAGLLLGIVGGGAVGAATAPSAVKRVDSRARAELAVADGNRYYEAARYDDAVGKYKNAINNDRTYAPAHRAKGAALAKQAQKVPPEQAQRLYDEAAAAYREYLALEPSAIDGADITDALTRRGLKPVATGATDG